MKCNNIIAIFAVIMVIMLSGCGRAEKVEQEYRAIACRKWSTSESAEVAD